MSIEKRFLVDSKIFEERRNRLIKSIDDGVVIIPSAELKQRSNDTEYNFRQNSNFYYLTGFREENSILVIVKKGNNTSTCLYLEDKDPLLELWTGIRLGKDDAPKALGIENSKSIKEFEGDIEGILTGCKNIYLSAFHENKITKLVYKRTNELWNRRRKQDFIPTQVTHIDHLIERQRLIKDVSEIELIKKSAEITTKAHLACMSYCSPNKNERDLEGCLHFFFRQKGGSGEAYSSIVAAGNNANILHYIENDSELRDGDLILIDAGSEYNLYACDVTRTFPINGKFSPAQKEVYEIVLNAQLKTIEASKPGVTLADLHEVAQKELIKGLIDLSILQGDPEELYQNEAHRKYYPHGTGHWLGLDVHDQCPYLDDENNGIKLSAGMYFTVEPGLYFNQNDLSIPSKYRGIGVRIEDDVLITKTGNEVITKNIPKTVEDIEKACNSKFSDFLVG